MNIITYFNMSVQILLFQKESMVTTFPSDLEYWVSVFLFSQGLPRRKERAAAEGKRVLSENPRDFFLPTHTYTPYPPQIAYLSPRKPGSGSVRLSASVSYSC